MRFLPLAGSFIVAAAVSSASLPALARDAHAAVLVPAGTLVPIHVLGDVSSHTAHEGDTFQIEVAKDVVVGGLIVVQANADGEGEITSVDHAGGNGHSGSLFGHNFAHGKEVTVDPKTVLKAFVANSVHVHASTRAVADEQYDH